MANLDVSSNLQNEAYAVGVEGEILRAEAQNLAHRVSQFVSRQLARWKELHGLLAGLYCLAYPAVSTNDALSATRYWRLSGPYAPLTEYPDAWIAVELPTGRLVHRLDRRTADEYVAAWPSDLGQLAASGVHLLNASLLIIQTEGRIREFLKEREQERRRAQAPVS